MADDFFELYRRPEWQKKRLEVMQAADFACQECGTKDAILNVHHRFYRKGAKPWEYKNSELICLCEPCHKERHELVIRHKEITGILSTESLHRAIGYAAALVLQECLNVRFVLNGEIEACGVADLYRVPWYEIPKRLDKDGAINDEQLVKLRELAFGPQRGGSPSGPSKC